jgi:hypothetical protein
LNAHRVDLDASNFGVFSLELRPRAQGPRRIRRVMRALDRIRVRFADGHAFERDRSAALLIIALAAIQMRVQELDELSMIVRR